MWQLLHSLSRSSLLASLESSHAHDVADSSALVRRAQLCERRLHRWRCPRHDRWGVHRKRARPPHRGEYRHHAWAPRAQRHIGARRVGRRAPARARRVGGAGEGVHRSFCVVVGGASLRLASPRRKDRLPVEFEFDLRRHRRRRAWSGPTARRRAARGSAAVVRCCRFVTLLRGGDCRAARPAACPRRFHTGRDARRPSTTIIPRRRSST